MVEWRNGALEQGARLSVEAPAQAAPGSAWLAAQRHPRGWPRNARGHNARVYGADRAGRRVRPSAGAMAGAPALVYTLQGQGAGAGAVMSVTHGGRAYAVGFRRASHAARVAAAHDPARPLRLQTALPAAPLAARRALAAPPPAPRVALEVPVLPPAARVRALALKAVPVEEFVGYPGALGLGIVIVPLASEVEVLGAGQGGTGLLFEPAQIVEPEERATEALRASLDSLWRG